MEAKVTAWFRQRRYVGTKEYRNTLLALLVYLEYGKAKLYWILSRKTGDSYQAISRSVGRGTRKIWESERIFCQEEEKPTPMYILEELAVEIKRDCGLE